MKTLPIDEGAFTVLCVFDCNPGESERLANEIAEAVDARMRFHPGFLSSMIYLSEDACRVFKLFQWARVENWEAYRASEDGRLAVEQLAGRSVRLEFLELIRAIGPPAPGRGLQDASRS
ncbi:MAG TPA: hypothetical protein VMQ83_12695 [Gammaproteobacteria bacterium]|nr:hypothetical protein [Gammaproteobacteria bacterium]